MNSVVDKRKVSRKSGDAASFSFLEAHAEVPFEAVTSASVVAWTSQKRLVVIKQGHGVDLPGGHVQVGEAEVFATVRREAMEEACITLRSPQLFGYLKSDVFESPTYIGLVTAQVEELLEYVPEKPADERLILEVPDFLTRYHGDKQLMSSIVVSANRVVCS